FLPFCNLMERKKVPKNLSVFVCLVSFLLVVFIVISILGFKVSELITDLEIIKLRAIEMGNTIQKYIFDTLNISYADQFVILKNEQPSYSNIMQFFLGSVAYVFATTILVLVYFVFLLYYRNHIKNFLIKITKSDQQEEMQQVIFSATHISQQYLIGLSKMIFLLWIMYGIGFSIIGVENALFFAVLCGVLEIVPYVGNITGTIVTILFAAFHGGNPTLLIGIVITYGIVQFIQGWILEPLILGPQVKINPLFTIIVLVLGELLWGIPGVILAIPLTAILKIVCDHIEPLKPYGFLIGEIETPKKEIGLVKKIKKIIKPKK
ncbi:MAG: AI-2E family transporter, partial [Flavobacterium sp.]|nr:AI-2E family transporter [Flavobacterium sp.]